MQQRCTRCGYYLQPGSAVCSNCGTPVSTVSSGSYGAGSYDPTIRAGAPPGPGYGSQPYDAPPPPTYGAPPANFGAPPPTYGTAPAYGAPPQPGFGAPPPQMYPVMQPARKSGRGLLYGLGGLGVVVVIIVVAVVVLGGVFKFKQEVTTGIHITAIHTGTGFDTNTGAVLGEKDSFHTGDEVWIVYTVTNPDPNSQVVLKLYNDGTYESSSSPVALDSQTNTYANSVTVHNTGSHKVELYYNGTQEGSITFDVT